MAKAKTVYPIIRPPIIPDGRFGSLSNSDIAIDIALPANIIINKKSVINTNPTIAINLPHFAVVNKYSLDSEVISRA